MRLVGKVGKMKYLITLQQQQNMVSDGMGGYKPATGDGWADVATVFANIELPHRLSTEIWQGQLASEILFKFAIWRRDDVRIGWRCTWNNKIFLVMHTYLFDQLTTVVVCKEVEV